MVSFRLAKMSKTNLWASLKDDIRFVFETKIDHRCSRSYMNTIARFQQFVCDVLQHHPTDSKFSTQVTAEFHNMMRSAYYLENEAALLKELILKQTDEIEQHKEQFPNANHFLTCWNAIFMWLDGRPYVSNALYQFCIKHAHLFMSSHTQQLHLTTLFQFNGAVAPYQPIHPPQFYSKLLLRDYKNTTQS